jgi:hypothetical protein
MIIYLIHSRLDKATSESKMIVDTDILNTEIAFELNKIKEDGLSDHIFFINASSPE